MKVLVQDRHIKYIYEYNAQVFNKSQYENVWGLKIFYVTIVGAKRQHAFLSLL